MLKSVLNDKYEWLKYMYNHCVLIDDEFVITESIDKIVEHTTRKRRKVCYMINELKNEGFITNSIIKVNQYTKNAFTKEGLEKFKN